jgi:hypothetical protein
MLRDVAEPKCQRHRRDVRGHRATGTGARFPGSRGPRRRRPEAGLGSIPVQCAWNYENGKLLHAATEVSKYGCNALPGGRSGSGKTRHDPIAHTSATDLSGRLRGIVFAIGATDGDLPHNRERSPALRKTEAHRTAGSGRMARMRTRRVGPAQRRAFARAVMEFRHDRHLKALCMETAIVDAPHSRR